MTFGSALTDGGHDLMEGCVEGTDTFDRIVPYNTGADTDGTVITQADQPPYVPESEWPTRGLGVGPLGWWFLAGGTGLPGVGVAGGYAYVPKRETGGWSRTVCLWPMRDWYPPFEFLAEVYLPASGTTTGETGITLGMDVRADPSHPFDDIAGEDYPWVWWAARLSLKGTALSTTGLYLSIDATRGDRGADDIVTWTDSGNSVRLTTSEAASADKAYWFRVRWENTYIVARVWEVGTAEPGTWHLRGSLKANQYMGDFLDAYPKKGLLPTVYIQSGKVQPTQVRSVKMSCDVDSVDTVPAGLFEDFTNRAVAATGSTGWGLASGGTYTWVTPGAGANPGTFVIDAATCKWDSLGVASAQSEQGFYADGPWRFGADFRETMRLRFFGTAPSSGSKYVVSGFPRDAENYYALVSWIPGGNVQVSVGVSPAVAVAGYAAGSWMLFKWEHLPSQGVSRAKAWLEGQPEPGWLSSRSTTADTLPGGSQNGLSLFMTNSAQSTAFSIEFDYVNIEFV